MCQMADMVDLGFGSSSLPRPTNPQPDWYQEQLRDNKSGEVTGPLQKRTSIRN